MAESFRPTGPLPDGVTVLEASAGTGKTYTIEGLVARYVADGRSLRRLLVVTFTRVATAELRDRVRRRLVHIADHLDRTIAGGQPNSNDDVAVLLASGETDEVKERYDRLVTALTEFDAATISTIHGFCQQVLAGLGLTGDVDRQVTLVEDQRELIEAVVDDVLVRRYASGPGAPAQVSRGDLQRITQALVGNSDAAIVPHDATGPVAIARVALAAEVMEEIDRRKRLGALLSYDDLLTRLRDALRDPERGPAASERLRAQYDIALVDEFQDTDPVQWEILRRVFGTQGRALVLIGDPKQAIYAFRGADVYAYLDAIQQASTATLDTNWRSDQGLLDAYNALFRSATLGHREIPYRQVAAYHGAARLVGDVGAPLRLRYVRAATAHVRTNDKGVIYADAARDYAARDAASEIVALLESGALLTRTDGPPEIRPQDIAVLARTNAEAALVQRVLRDADVPAVINGVGSVFATTAATDWLRLLEALEQPSSGSRARAAAVTVFLGRTANWVADASDDDLEPIHETLRRWAGVLRDRSVASLYQTITLHERLPARLLSSDGGERQLTDTEHIAELLHAASVNEELGLSALAAWLRERIAEAPEEVEAEDRARRLESDAEAVQVLTIHRSKGLEFPIVLCPFLWSQGYVDTAVPIFHDPDAGDRRSIDVGKGEEAFVDHQKLSRREQRGEQLRLVYVALTRAKHQAVVWWLPANFSHLSPLARLLFCRKPSGEANPACENVTSVPKDDVAAERLASIAALAPHAIAVEEAPATPPRRKWTGADQTAADLQAATFDRAIDRRWRRNSYSGMTRLAHAEPVVGSEPEQPIKDDEALAPAAVEPPVAGEHDELRAVTLPLADMAGGVDVGTFVHGVLEDTDFAAGDLAAEVELRVREQLERRPLELGTADVADGLRRAIETPLGPLVGDLSLRAFGQRDRLTEVEFELPLLRGLSGRGEVTVAMIGRLLATHLAADDPLRPYAEQLGKPVFVGDLRGYLTGSIDLVLRVPGAQPGYVVVDHKTNWLATGGEALTAWHYRPAALVAAMERGHYPLQALLYTVALHRYLRWRQPGYDPDVHLAGVLYLFLRGMSGADVPRVDGHPCGVFSWRPPTSLVVALSDLLDRGEVAA